MEKEIKGNKKGKKFLMIMLLIVSIIIILFMIHTIRNYIIITSLQNKISEYANTKNYYMKFVSKEENGTIITMEYYRKNSNQVTFLSRNLNGEISKVSMYDNGEKTDNFTETKDKKIVQLNSGTSMVVNVYNYLETDNNWQTFLGSIFSKVKSTKYNNKECYIISKFMSSTSLNYKGEETYIEKDTGLAIKNIGNGIITEKEYSFNNVEDSIFVEPDISQYVIKDNN